MSPMGLSCDGSQQIILQGYDGPTPTVTGKVGIAAATWRQRGALTITVVVLPKGLDLGLDVGGDDMKFAVRCEDWDKGLVENDRVTNKIAVGLVEGETTRWLCMHICSAVVDQVLKPKPVEAGDLVDEWEKQLSGKGHRQYIEANIAQSGTRYIVVETNKEMLHLFARLAALPKD
ncbi:hypothetical protein B0H34DRAFT_670569 [Crassisporium funariophilum]|nr:hypothetical protein B0H34DRAFT_670569 [Crassisporium funariophilum]